MEIDRIAPTRRPPGWPISRQRWRTLLFLHWPVPTDAVAPLLPAGLDLDLCQGSAWISLIPFAMEAVRPVGVPAPFGMNVLETNLRTYVHVGGADPGVYFFSLDIASRLATWAARAGFGLPYYTAAMRLERAGERIDYAMRRRGGGPALRASWSLGEPLDPAEPGTLDHFLVERYFLHVVRRGRLMTGQVHHPPYPLRRARLDALEEDLTVAAGLPRPVGPPVAVHASDGVDVDVYWLRPAGGGRGARAASPRSEARAGAAAEVVDRRRSG